MPVTWTISHPSRLVIAVAKESVAIGDMQDYLDDVMVAGAMSYRKIFDLSNGSLDLSTQEMMALGARIRAYNSTTRMGPLAIVASTPQAYERAQHYMTLASASRPMQVFAELHVARKWLDQLDPPPG